MVISLKNIKNYFKLTLISIILFIYLYSLLVSAIPIGLDKLLTVFTFLLIFPFNIKKFIFFLKRNTLIVKYYILLILLLSYNGFIFSINASSDTTLLYSFILRLTVFYFPIVFILFYLHSTFKYSDYVNFILKLLLFIISIQSFLVLLSFINHDVKLYIDTILPYTGNIGVTRLDRMRGFSNSSGATLSIVQGIGAYIALLLLDKSNLFYMKFFYMLFIIINLLAVLFVGRTGLVLFVICGSLFIFSTFSYKAIKNIFYITIGSFLLFYIILNFNFLIDSKFTDIFYTNILPWALKLFLNIFENHSITTDSTQELWHMIHFPNTFKTLIFGDGIFKRAYTLSDSGYVRYIYAMGIIGIFLLILSIIFPIIKIKNYRHIDKREFYWMIFLIGFMLFIDIKEPFLLKPQSYPLILILIFTFIIKFNDFKEKVINCKN